MKDVEDMEFWKEKVQQDINDIRQRQGHNEEKLSSMQSEIHKLQVSDQLQNQEISSLKEVLKGIQDDTKWIRRKITGAFITAVITALVAGIIGIAVTNIWG